jgi:hypothetical protein
MIQALSMGSPLHRVVGLTSFGSRCFSHLSFFGGRILITNSVGVNDSTNSLLTSNTDSMVFRILIHGKPKFTD